MVFFISGFIVSMIAFYAWNWFVSSDKEFSGFSVGIIPAILLSLFGWGFLMIVAMVFLFLFFLVIFDDTFQENKDLFDRVNNSFKHKQ